MDFMFFIFACFGGTIMVVQFILTLFGLGDDDGGFDADIETDVDLDSEHNSISDAADADIHGSSWLFEVLSLRSIVAGITFFGLGGMFARASEWALTASLMFAGVLGMAGIYLTYWTMQQVYKLRSSGNVNIRNAAGESATVYIPIPGANAGRGKVHLTVQGRTMEYEAITDDTERLVTGESVVVTEIVGNDLVRVSRIAELSAV